MPGIAGLILNSGYAAPSTARQLIAPITAAADRIEAGAMGHAAFARAEHDLPVQQGGLLKRQSFLVAVSGWVAGLGARSLAEYCLERYIEHGADGLANLNGTYAVAIWDARDQLVVLAQDRLGCGGLCYTDTGGSFGFASRPRALRRLVPPGIDGRALGQILTIGTPLGDRTLFEGVRQLGPAGLAIWRHGRLHLRRTWSMPTADESPRTEREEDRAIAAWDAALDAAVADAVGDIDAGTRVVLPLSGGLDSRTLLAHARSRMALHTCSYGHAHSRDRRYGGRLARIARTTHRAFDLPGDYMERLGPTLIEWTEGQASLHAAHVLALGDTLRSSPSIMLSGYLGGALIGPRLTTDSPVSAAASSVDAQGTALFEHAYRKGFDDTALARLLRPEYARLARGAAQEAFLASYREGHGPIDRASRVHFDLRQSRYISYQLHALGAVAPVRAPFTDHRLLDQALTWPFTWRDGKRLHKRYLCQAYPDLARVGHTATGIPLAGPARWISLLEGMERFRCYTLPHWTRDRFRPHDYRQYAHYDDMIRGDARGFFVDQLAEHSLPEEVFDAGQVTDLLQAHLDGRIDAYEALRGDHGHPVVESVHARCGERRRRRRDRYRAGWLSAAVRDRVAGPRPAWHGALLRSGILSGAAAHALWGLLPVFWKALAGVPALEVLCHRSAWSFLFILALLTGDNRWHRLRAAIRNRRTLLTVTATPLLIGLNRLALLAYTIEGVIRVRRMGAAGTV